MLEGLVSRSQKGDAPGGSWISADLLRALTCHSKLTEGPFQFSSPLLAMLALLFVVGGQELPKELWAPEQRGRPQDVNLAAEDTKEETALLKV